MQGAPDMGDVRGDIPNVWDGDDGSENGTEPHQRRTATHGVNNHISRAKM